MYYKFSIQLNLTHTCIFIHKVRISHIHTQIRISTKASTLSSTMAKLLAHQTDWIIDSCSCSWCLCTSLIRNSQSNLILKAFGCGASHVFIWASTLSMEPSKALVYQMIWSRKTLPSFPLFHAHFGALFGTFCWACFVQLANRKTDMLQFQI